ncbi:response regulator [Trichothermofontia sp.]
MDDTPQTLQWIATLLREYGYAVRGAINGLMALRSVKTEPPELILLDVNMPHMDGYAVCQRLKADPDTADIPVIFVSSLTEVLSKVRAFEVGGADYLTKTLQMEKVVARTEH